jgi:hypothetical protein
VGTDKGLEAGQSFGRPAEDELGFGQVLDGTEAGLLEPMDVEAGEVPLGQLAERRAAPQAEPGSQRLGRLVGSTIC